jgi:hypothetical protein
MTVIFYVKFQFEGTVDGANGGNEQQQMADGEEGEEDGGGGEEDERAPAPTRRFVYVTKRPRPKL